MHEFNYILAILQIMATFSFPSALFNFEILIGDVDFEQTDELLESAARDGDTVVASVTDDQQTAIVTDGAAIRLDWSRWVNEMLGGLAMNATYTIRRTQLNESGYIIGAPTVVEGTDRIVVEFDSEDDEYYVVITDVISVAGAEDPDRAIYELEACVPNANGSETCYRSNMTVFAIQEPIIIDPLSTYVFRIVCGCYGYVSYLSIDSLGFSKSVAMD